MIGSSVDRLLAVLEMAPQGDDVFVAPALDAPAGPGRMFGGEVAARALAAAHHTIAADRVVHVAQAQFLRPGDPEVPSRILVVRLRDGRRFSVRRVDVEQRGKLIFSATFSFHVGGQAVAHQDPMPAVPAPEALGDVAGWIDQSPMWPDWIQESGVELRPVPGSLPGGRQAVWYRVPGPVPADPRVHACLWMYASDLTLVASVRLPHEPTPRKSWLMTSLNHTVWFHRSFPVDEWHLLAQRSSAATAGRG